MESALTRDIQLMEYWWWRGGPDPTFWMGYMNYPSLAALRYLIQEAMRHKTIDGGPFPIHRWAGAFRGCLLSISATEFLPFSAGLIFRFDPGCQVGQAAPWGRAWCVLASPGSPVLQVLRPHCWRGGDRRVRGSGASIGTPCPDGPSVGSGGSGLLLLLLAGSAPGGSPGSGSGCPPALAGEVNPRDPLSTGEWISDRDLFHPMLKVVR